MANAANVSDSNAWSRKLIEHKIFNILKKNNTEQNRTVFENDAKNLIDIKDGEIYVWDAYAGSLLTTNIRRLNDESLSSADLPAFQMLRCSDDPAKFDIRRILCNPLGSHVVLIGSTGLSVLELPVRRGKFGMFNDGEDTIRCRVINLDERLFLTSDLKILHADWHPGSMTFLRLTVLTSDSTLRMYDCDKPLTSVWKMSLRPEDNESVFSPSRLHTAFVLGETVVSFDFGRCIEMKRSSAKKHLCLDDRDRRSDEADGGKGSLWPIYLLLGNGVVYRLLTSLNCLVPSKYQLCGPLRMNPPAEDNYGTDACSIAALNTTPEVLVVATADGKLHHCIVLGTDDNDQPPDEDTNSIEVEDSGLRQLLQEPSLYVFETIELELSLTVLSATTNLPSVDNFSCPIKLHKDVLCVERYHCYHGAGVHSVVLPWTQKFKYYIEKDDAEELLLSGLDEHSIVAHIICTKPLSSSPWSPIMGLSLVPDRLISPKLVCLTSTMECLVLPLLNSYQMTTMELYSEMPSPSSSSRPYGDLFYHRIQKLLTRSVTNPPLRTSALSELSAQECFELLSRTTQVFRQHYIQKQETVLNEISRRVRLLKESKEQQVRELSSLQQTHNLLQKSTKKLSKKCELATEKQDAIFNRLTHLLTKLESFVPVLSDSEVAWKKELTGISENVEALKTKINRVKNKAEYQSRIYNGDEELSSSSRSIQGSPLRSSCSFTSASFASPRASPRSTRPVELSSAESQILKSLLSKEGDAIAKLVNQVNSIGISLTP